MSPTFLKRLNTVIGLCAALAVNANNIQVTNVTLTDITTTTAKVQFDISWENSWRGGPVINWDAAWVFVKCKLGNGAWVHARLSNAGHTQPAGSQIDPGLLTPGSAYHVNDNPVIGVFLRRATDGAGTFSITGVQLLWDYSAQGIATSSDILEVKVFGIEMVYVNEGAFTLGAGGSEVNQFHTGTVPTYQVTSEDPLFVSTTTLWANALVTNGVLPAGFPKGYRASYVMKYEISQQQYVDFLNTLNRQQQNTCIAGTDNDYVLSNQNIVIYRQRILTNSNPTSPEPLLFSTGLPDVACNFLEPYYLKAFLDWSGLRPMTELEYEKACRGPLPPIPNEYAWGSAALASGATSYTINAGGSNESIATGYGSANGNFTAFNGDVYTMGPFRVGVFAAHPSNTSRATAGGSYYGIMELSGNLVEQVVPLSDAASQSYAGVHGDGVLYPNGGSNAAFPISPLMWRGGACFTMPAEGRVSDRTGGSGGGGFAGGRGVRTAP